VVHSLRILSFPELESRLAEPSIKLRRFTLDSGVQSPTDFS